MGKWSKIKYIPAKKRKQNIKENQMPFGYTQDDVARTTVVEEAGWHLCKITDYTEKVSKKEGRQGIANHILTFKVEDAADKYNGLVVLATFPEDYPTMAFPFLSDGMGVKLEKSGGSIDFAEFKNDTVWVMIEPGDYQGKPTNNIKAYRHKSWNPGATE